MSDINDILKNMISDPKINIQNFKNFALMLFKRKKRDMLAWDLKPIIIQNKTI